MCVTNPRYTDATSYRILPEDLACFLGGPPLYDSALDFLWATASGFSATWVPEVLESSLQPINRACEPINRLSRRMRPRRNRAVLMFEFSIGQDEERTRPWGNLIE
jgi:hypothetical protein